MTYNKNEARKAKKTNDRSKKPVRIDEDQMKKNKSKNTIEGV